MQAILDFFIFFIFVFNILNILETNKDHYNTNKLNNLLVLNGNQTNFKIVDCDLNQKTDVFFYYKIEQKDNTTTIKKLCFIRNK